MKMRFRIFKNILKQGFVNLWRNRGMGIASVSSITAVLLILGVVLISILSINNIANETQNQFDEIKVYLDKGLSDSDIERIGEVISDFDGVISVIFESKEYALEVMKKQFGDEAYLLDGLEENPFPDSYVVQLKSIEEADIVVERIKGIKGIEDVKYYKDIIEKLISLANSVRIGGLIVISILMMISIFIISNTIKLTVAARKREINIMKYVGATNGYIRGPFVIEGIFLGIIGAALSIVIVKYGYQYVFSSMSQKMYLLLTVYMIPPYALLKDVVIMFMTIGIGIGALGSIVSMRRFLNV